MAHSRKPARRQRKNEKFKQRHGDASRSLWAAKKKLKNMENKQAKNVKSGRKGHTPTPRKILKQMDIE